MGYVETMKTWDGLYAKAQEALGGLYELKDWADQHYAGLWEDLYGSTSVAYLEGDLNAEIDYIDSLINSGISEINSLTYYLARKIDKMRGFPEDG